MRYKSTHFRYALAYVIITAFVLLFLNIYTSKVNQKMFYNNKATSMTEKSQTLASELAGLDIWNPTTVGRIVSDPSYQTLTRVIITDQSANIIYDSVGGSTYAILPEVITALQSNNVFSWQYHDAAMHSKAAVPIVAYGSIVGCVYITEYDAAQGALIHNLQMNTLTITVVLEVAVIIFSIFFSNSFTRRLRRIMTSMRIIRDGDYTHKVEMGGNDELTVLGNEFDDLLERLQASEQTRRNFVSDASHELKTPLASIKLLSDSILQNEMDPQTVKEFVCDIGNEADRLNRMAQKLLSLAKTESPEEPECEIIYISPTITRVTRMLSALADDSGITVNTNILLDSSVLIYEDDLYQIIFNLVKNGIKYNTPGGVLDITLTQETDNAILRIADTGVGIPEDSVKHIFDRFYRVDKARSRKSGGSGLGLSIVQSLVERNNGTIRVESVIGKGTVFEVTFPIFDTEEDTE